MKWIIYILLALALFSCERKQQCYALEDFLVSDSSAPNIPLYFGADSNWMHDLVQNTIEPGETQFTLIPFNTSIPFLDKNLDITLFAENDLDTEVYMKRSKPSVQILINQRGQILINGELKKLNEIPSAFDSAKVNGYGYLNKWSYFPFVILNYHPQAPQEIVYSVLEECVTKYYSFLEEQLNLEQIDLCTIKRKDFLKYREELRLEIVFPSHPRYLSLPEPIHLDSLESLPK